MAKIKFPNDWTKEEWLDMIRYLKFNAFCKITAILFDFVIHADIRIVTHGPTIRHPFGAIEIISGPYGIGISDPDEIFTLCQLVNEDYGVKNFLKDFYSRNEIYQR